MLAILRNIISRLGWVLLALLAAFVIFVECIAEVGGSVDPIPQPPRTPVPIESPLNEGPPGGS